MPPISPSELNSLATAILGLFTALALTIAVEAAAGWLLGLRDRHSQVVLLLINVITNPALNLLLAALAYFHIHIVASPFDPALLLMEAVVIVAEAALLRLTLRLSLLRSAAVSAAANAASWLAGALLLWGIG